VWVDEGPVREAAEAAVARANDATPRRPGRAPRPLPDDVQAELEAQAGAKRAPRLGERLEAARGAFERERYIDARRMLLLLAQEAPGAASVRELLGLTYYRLDRWKQAVTELEAYRALTGAVDQHPVLMDCYRALRRYRAVEDLWDELRAASPGPARMSEGRIVLAGSLADQGKLGPAIALLEKADSSPKKVRDDHLRQWYVLGDLYDRGGDAPRARHQFARIRQVDPTFADVEDRLRTLGR
jgi:tetratricopeptide (TPR) repeat protein